MSEQNPNPAPAPPPVHSGPKRLTRSSHDSMIAGVCGGLAQYFGVDPTLIRIAAVVALLVAFPAVLVGYVVGWAIMPKA